MLHLQENARAPTATTTNRPNDDRAVHEILQFPFCKPNTIQQTEMNYDCVRISFCRRMCVWIG